MASNPNTKHKAAHTLVIGSTGARKSTWIKNKSGLIKSVPELTKCQRWAFWDPDEDHTGRRYTTVSGFIRALSKAVAGGKSWRLCLTVDPTPENFERFCRALWAVLDGAKPTAIVAEELADVTTPSKAGSYWGQLLRKGRKYGAVVVAASQRPQEIDKTAFSQCVNKWVGFLAVSHDLNRMAKETGIKPAELESLGPGDFYFLPMGSREPVRGKVGRR